MSTFVCDKCGESVEEDKTVLSRLPDVHFRCAAMIELCETLRKNKGQVPDPERRYHTVWARVFSKRREPYLCGPMHEENEQEYFVRWVST